MDWRHNLSQKAWKLPDDMYIEDTSPVTLSKASCKRLAFLPFAATMSHKDSRKEPAMAAQSVIPRRHMRLGVGYSFGG
jgi:hypothetical protein